MAFSLIAFIVILSILVLVHEGGHFFAARRFGIWVEEFGFGLPPRAWGKKIKDTIYSLNWLPFGGFVRLHGENLEDTIQRPEVAFLNKSKKVRATVICAGVFMNIILGILAFSVVYTFNGVPRETGHVKVLAVSKDSPADAGGLKEGDIIDSLNGQLITNNDQFIKGIDQERGKEVSLNITREGKTDTVKVTPRLNPPANEGALGVAIGSREIYFPPIWQRPFYGIYYGFGDAIFWGKAVLTGFRDMILQSLSGHVPKDIAGPIGIYQVTNQVAALGILPLINFMGVLSVNLAIINILPIPALDGGRLLFIIFEAITRKRVTPKIEATIHSVGMIALLGLLVVITFFDIKRLADAGNLPPFLLQFFK